VLGWHEAPPQQLVSDNNKLIFKTYNKTDDFYFEVCNFPFPGSNIYSNITYSAFS